MRTLSLTTSTLCFVMSAVSMVNAADKKVVQTNCKHEQMI